MRLTIAFSLHTFYFKVFDVRINQNASTSAMTEIIVQL